MTTDCEHFEIDLGMRAHGALDAEEAAALDAHLATCAGCRHFAESNDALDAALKTRVASETARVDWSKVERGIARVRRAYRLNLWLAPVLALGPPAAMWVMGKNPLRADALAMGVGIALLFMLSTWLWYRPLRIQTENAQGAVDLLQGYLSELRRQRWRTTIGVVGFPLLAIGWLYVVATEPHKMWHLFNCAFVTAFGVFMLFNLRRVRREIAELQS